ncbi:MAG: DUF1684 domain-containing protein [Acidobacteriota bacterium]
MSSILPLATFLLAAAASAGAGAIQDIEAWWKNRLQSFVTSETSPLAAVASYYMAPGERVPLAAGAGETRAKEPLSHGVVVKYTGGGFELEFANCKGVSLDGKASPSTSRIQVPGAQDVVKADGLVLQFSAQGERGRVMVFRPGTEKQTRFAGFRRFPADLRYRVTARLTRLEKPQPVTMGTSQGLFKKFVRTGYFDFDIAGRKFRLYVYCPEGGGKEDLFLPFKDGNAGGETYMAGRYVDVEGGDDGSYTVDFNLAYNPLCAVSPYYNCARPPAENCIGAKIEAGEKAPAEHP